MTINKLVFLFLKIKHKVGKTPSPGVVYLHRFNGIEQASLSAPLFDQPEIWKIVAGVQ